MATELFEERSLLTALTGRLVSRSISRKVLLLLPRLFVKVSEIGASQMKVILIKILIISGTKRKTGDLSGGCKNAGIKLITRRLPGSNPGPATKLYQGVRRF